MYKHLECGKIAIREAGDAQDLYGKKMQSDTRPEAGLGESQKLLKMISNDTFYASLQHCNLQYTACSFE